MDPATLLSPPPHRDYQYRVDVEGRIFHDGSEIVDPHVLRFFVLAMTPTGDGRWLVPCQGESNWFEPEDTPLVVQQVRAGPGRRGLELVLAGDAREKLDPATLEVAEGVLYCTVRGGRVRARFGRRAVQALAGSLVEEPGGLALVLDGDRHPIRPVGRPATPP